MDLSGHRQFDLRGGPGEPAQIDPIEADLERQKAVREADLMGPALAGSLSLLCAAWFAGAFWPMAAIAVLRLFPDFAAQTTARAIVARIDAKRDFRSLRSRAQLIALFTGAGWGLVTWPIRDAGMTTIGAIIILIAVHVAGIVVTVLTVPSPNTLKRWLTGLLIVMIVPSITSPSAGGMVIAVCELVFAGVMLWLSRLLHLQLRQLVTLQHTNADLNHEIAAVNAALASSLALAEHNARHDALTGLANRRSFEEQLVSLHPTSDAAGRHLLLIDIDRFKSINDRFGHASGDMILAALSEVIAAEMKDGESCARWGGEEFVALLLDCDVDAALARAELLRQRISLMRPPGCPPKLLPVTASIGVAPWTPGDALQTVVARADHAMYEAKHHGRNRAHYATPQG